jgi:prepilin-type processing-associated H-X9-DG protein
MYVEDNADTLPWAWWSTQDTVDGWSKANPWNGYGANNFAVQILPYVQSTDIFQCNAYGNNGRALSEADAAAQQGFVGTMTWPLVSKLGGKTFMTMLPYKANPYLGFDGYGFGILQGAGCGNWGITGRKLARDVINGDSKVLIFDADRAWSAYATSPGCANTAYVGPADGDRSLFSNYTAGLEWERPNIGLYHQFRSNVLFFDGHVDPHDKYSAYTYQDLTDSHWKIGK